MPDEPDFENDAPDRVVLPHCVIDLGASQVIWPDRRIPLTQIERRFLQRLACTPGVAVSHETLLEQVWGYHPRVRSRAPAVSARRVRTKMEVEPSSPEFFKSVYGVGFRLDVPEDEHDDVQLAEEVRALLAVSPYLDGADRPEAVGSVVGTAPALDAALGLLSPRDTAHVAMMLCHAGMADEQFFPPLATCRARADQLPRDERHRVLAAVLSYNRFAGAMEEAREESEQLVTDLPESSRAWGAGDTELASIHAELLQLGSLFEGACTWAEHALAQARRLGLRRLVGKNFDTLAVVAQRLGDKPLARQRYLDAISVLDTDQQLTEAARSRHNLALLDYEEGRFDEARESIEAAVATLETLGSSRDAGFGQISLATICLSQGDYERAFELAGRALEHGRRGADGLLECLAGMQRWRAALALGRVDEAFVGLSRARHVAEDHGGQRIRSHSSRYLGLILLWRGEMVAARRRLREAWAYRQPSDAWSATMVLCWLARTYEGRPATQRRLRAAAERVAEDCKLTVAQLEGEGEAPPGPWVFDRALARLVAAGDLG